MFDESDKVGAYVKQKNIGMKIDYNGKARQVLKTSAPPQESDKTDAKETLEEKNGANRAMRRIIQQKLLHGDELMADEMRFLKRFDTGLYTKARAAQDAREALAQKLEKATSKEEASEAFLIASGMVNKKAAAAPQNNVSPTKRNAVASPAKSSGASSNGSKLRTRWKLDLSNTSEKGAVSKPTTMQQPMDAKDQKKGIATPPSSEDTTGIEFIMGRALQSAWAKFIQTPKYRELISTTEHSIENLDPSNMTVATRFVSASRAYRNLPKVRKGVPQQSFDSET
ncbi:hypothetical protein QCO44_01570 [Selenomonas sputigena]|uniref:Uncharacterized protein n=1 Tax=Selenomonas sputigena TaxID=69823 RepID=A0ABV3X2J4_9FIRM